MNQQPLPGPYTKQEVTAFFIAITVVGLIVYILFFKSDPAPEPMVVSQPTQKPSYDQTYTPPIESAKEATVYTKQQALIESRQFIRSAIKHPESAEYDQDYEKHVTQENDSTFYVTSFVVSPNSYGVKSRALYTATVVFHTAKGIVTCDDAYLTPYD